MHLKSVTVYNSGCAHLSFEHQILTTRKQEVIISELPGEKFDDRLTINVISSEEEEEEGADFQIYDCGWVERTVTRTSWLELNNEEVRDAFTKLKSILKEMMVIQEAQKACKARDEACAELVKNTFSPPVLMAKLPLRVGADEVENLLLVSEKAEKLRLEFYERDIDSQVKLEMLREEALAAQKNLIRLSEGSKNPLIPPLPENFKLQYFDDWFNRKSTATVRDIHIAYGAKSVGEKVKLEIEYLVANASWKTEMNCKISGNNLENCFIDYSAQVKQSTNLDWRDIPIYLTNGNPARDQSPPTTSKTYVDLQSASPDSLPTCNLMAKKVGKKRMLFGGAPPAPRAPERPAIETRASFGNLRILLPEHTCILSKPENQKIVISHFNLTSKLYHHLIPDAQKRAYRCLMLTNTSDFTINNDMPMNLYVQGSLIGDYNLPRAIAKGNQFVIYAGHDDLIEIIDLGEKDFKSKSGNFLTGNSSKESCGSKLSIKNNHENGEQIELVISNRFPESKNHRVSVTIAPELASKSPNTIASENDILASEAFKNTEDVLNTKTGSYIQKRIIKSGESIQNFFGYSITYPHQEKLISWTQPVKA